MRIRCAAILLLAAAIACSPVPDQPPEAEVDVAHEIELIRGLLARSESIFVAGDYDAAMTLFDDDFVALWPGMDPVIGEEAIHTHYRENVFDRWNYIEHTHDTRQIEVAMPWAFWWGYGEGVIEPKSGGEQASFRLKAVMILRKQNDGSWKYSHSIYND